MCRAANFSSLHQSPSQQWEGDVPPPDSPVKQTKATERSQALCRASRAWPTYHNEGTHCCTNSGQASGSCDGLTEGKGAGGAQSHAHRGQLYPKCAWQFSLGREWFHTD